MYFRLLSLFLLAVGLAGCSTTGKHVQWYDGPPVERHQVAVLNVPRKFSGGSVVVQKIDGVPITRGKQLNTSRQIELPPGKHNLEVAYFNANGFHSRTNMPISFVAEAGKTYEMRGELIERSFGTTLVHAMGGGSWYWTLWIVDVDTNRVVAGDPRETPLRWYEK